MQRIILHADNDCFYASVECLYNPKLKGKPVSVCGSVENRHGIVLASTREAKRFGIKVGDAVWQAKQKCPVLTVVEPHMERYVRLSKIAHEIYSEYSPCIEPYGLDENWLDLTGSDCLFGDGQQVADTIRKRIYKEMGITVSIGVAFNKSMAKLGSDMNKPNGLSVITKDNMQEKVWPLPVSELLFVGPATTKKLSAIGISTIGQLAKANSDTINRRLGKNGILVWNYANGIDYEPVNATGYQHPIKSVGNSVTTSRDLVTEDDIRTTVMVLAESVAERMREKYFRCNVVQVSIRYSNLESYQRQEHLPFSSCTAQRIGDTAMRLILKNWNGYPLRSLGVRGCDLMQNETPQLSLYADQREEQRQEDLEIAMQELRRRFGHFSIQRGIMLADKELGGINTRQEDSPHTIAFYKGTS